MVDLSNGLDILDNFGKFSLPDISKFLSVEFITNFIPLWMWQVVQTGLMITFVSLVFIIFYFWAKEQGKRGE